MAIKKLGEEQTKMIVPGVDPLGSGYLNPYGASVPNKTAKMVVPGVDPLGSGYLNPYGASVPNATQKPKTEAEKPNSGASASVNVTGGGGGSASGSYISGVDADTYGRMTSKFQVSQAYTDAMNYTNQLLQQLSSGRTSYTDQVREIMDKINNRDPFSYDVDTDTLFQQYLASQMNAGKYAMQDTIGQASALTGGYGSSYATTAGNNAYNAYIQGAYNNLPEYYQMALDAYTREGDRLNQQYSMLSDADQREYQRLYDAYSANFANANNMYGQEFGEWSADVSQANQLAGMLNSDYWNRYQASQSAANAAASASASRKKWEEELAWEKEKYGLEQAQKAADAQKKADADANAQNQQISEDMRKAVEIYNTQGERGYAAYVDSLPYDDAVLARFDQMISDNGSLPMEQRSFTKMNSNQVRDQYGNIYFMDEIPEAVKKQLKWKAEGTTVNRK